MSKYDDIFNIPRRFRRGSLRDKPDESIESGKDILLYIESLIEGSLKTKDILDFGCGIKFTQAILRYDIPIKSYFGLDVYAGMIEYLKTHLNHPRFEFQIVDFQNDMYNVDGIPMRSDSVLPVGDRKFDLVIMQSVITHFKPEDTLAILKICKNYLRRKGQIFFTVSIEENMTELFKDKKPEKPLLFTSYQKNYIEGIIDKAGFEIQYFGNKDDEVKIKDHYLIQKKRRGIFSFLS